MIASLTFALCLDVGTGCASPARWQVLAGQSTTPRPSAPSSPSPEDDATAVARDPAEVVITTPSAVLLVPVKAALVADYESAITLLQAAFSAAEDAEWRAVASGWTVMKAAEADGKGNVVYVHLLKPVVSGVDYRPSVWLDRLVEALPLEVLDKYRDALAGPASLLSLEDLAIMTEPPASSTSVEGASTTSPATPSATPSQSGDSTAAVSPGPAVRRPGGGQR